MAAGTAMALLGTGLSIYQSKQAAENKREKEAQLADLEAPELDNAFQNIQISTLGSDLVREESQRTSANLINMAQQGGQASVMSMIPQIVSNNNRVNRHAQVDLDNQMQRREYAIAGDNARLRNMEERRYESEVAGLGQGISVAEQNIWNGINNAYGSALTVARGANGFKFNKQAKPDNSFTDVSNVDFTKFNKTGTDVGYQDGIYNEWNTVDPLSSIFD